MTRPDPPMASRFAPRVLYLHGFASGPESSKGRALSAFFEPYGVRLERLNLRRPSLEHLRLSAMMEHVQARIGGARDRAILFGSSLGGLTAARVAEADPRVAALVLLAPAFRLASEWEARLGPETWRRWRDEDALAIDDHTVTREGARRTTVDFGFVEEVARIDAAGGGWPDVRVPTLIVHGVQDEVVDVRLSREFAAGPGGARRHVRLVEVDDGHELGRSIDRIARESLRFLEPFFNV